MQQSEKYSSWDFSIKSKPSSSSLQAVTAHLQDMIFVDRAMSKVMEPIKMNATFMKKSIT
jgi:hypothetical protein